MLRFAEVSSVEGVHAIVSLDGAEVPITLPKTQADLGIMAGDIMWLAQQGRTLAYMGFWNR